MMRITNRAVSSRLLFHLETSQSRLAQTQERMASGSRISRPSDDPFAHSRALTARSQRVVLDQRMRNVDLAIGELSTAESTMESLTRVLTRAHELAAQADSSGIDAGARVQIAAEVDELLREAITIGNTSHGGRRIFGGHQTNVAPFSPDIPASPTAVLFAGDAGDRMHEIGEGERIAVNVQGAALFGDVFATLISFRDALMANDRPAIDTAGTQISARLDRVLEARGDVGARIRRLEMTQQRLGDEDMRLRLEIADMEEVDLTEEIVELQMRDTAFQAALSATGRALQASLMDFLR